MAKKPVKKQEVVQKKRNPDEIPTFKSPASTLWGKIVIIFIVAAMILLPVIFLIIELAKR